MLWSLPSTRMLMKRLEPTTLIANIIIATDVASVDFFTCFIDFIADELSFYQCHPIACLSSSIADAWRELVNNI